MAREILEREPQEFVAGETVQWQRSFVDFPVSEGWTVKYHLRGPSTLDITCTTSGDYHVATISATASALLTAGSYWWQAFAELGAERYLIDSNTLTVKAYLSSAAAGYDGRSSAKVMLDAINALIAGKATKDQLTSKVGEIEIGRMTPDQIERWRRIYQAEVANEKRADRRRRGLPDRRMIGMRFSEPT